MHWLLEPVQRVHNEKYSHTNIKCPRGNFASEEYDILRYQEISLMYSGIL